MSAGISRQLVGAIETGRNAPGVAAALALAAALGTTVEELFGRAGDPAVPFDRPAADGTPVLAVRVGEGMVAAALSDRGAGADRWQRADGVWRGGHVELFTDADGSGFAVAGCDPALGLAAELLPERGPRRLAAIAAPSGRAVAALDAHHLHAALVHGPPGRLRPNAIETAHVTLARWEVGLATRPGEAPDLDAIAAGQMRVARRDREAEAQQALERALGGRPTTVIGPVASGHLDAARRVTYGAVDAAVTMHSAALAWGLDFTPLEEHVVELRIAQRAVEHPGAAALQDVIVSGAFRARLRALGGYELATTGDTVL